jgi:hypothetical protein
MASSPRQRSMVAISSSRLRTGIAGWPGYSLAAKRLECSHSKVPVLVCR